MRRTTPLLLTLATLVWAALACAPPPFNYVRLSRPMALGEDQTVDIVPGDPYQRAASRKITLLGHGKLTVTVTPVNAQAKEQIDVFNETGGLPVDQGTSPLQVPDLAAGTYYVVAVAQNGVPTKVDIVTAFEPKDPEARSGAFGHEDGATVLDPTQLAQGTLSRGTVDYANLMRSHYYTFTLTDAGQEVKLDFHTHDPQRGNVTAAVKAPNADYANVAATGFDLKNAPAGSYFVRVQADPSSSAAYSLKAQAIAGDPDRASGDDATQDGADQLTFKPEPDGQNQLAQDKNSVDYDQGNRTNWYTFSAPDKGNCSIVFRPKDRDSDVRAEFVRESGQEEGDRIRSGFTRPCDKSPLWVRVYAPKSGDGGEYRLRVEYIPSKFVLAHITELGRGGGGCTVIVDKGMRDQVRTGAAANVVDGQGNTVAAGYVEEAYRNESRVRVSTDNCHFSGATVQIAGGY